MEIWVEINTDDRNNLVKTWQATIRVVNDITFLARTSKTMTTKNLSSLMDSDIW